MSQPLAVIVLAAGLGTRTKVGVPKALLPLCGRTLLSTVLDTVAELRAQKTVVVVHDQAQRVMDSESEREGFGDTVVFVDQGEPMGTGHAVQVAVGELEGFEGSILVVYGDVPLMTVATLRRLVERRGEGQDAAAAAVLTAHQEPPHDMGRILRREDGRLLGVLEAEDCDEDQRWIEEFNVGTYCFDAKRLPGVLQKLSSDNAQGELYLTDTVGILLAETAAVETLTLTDIDEALGINNLEELALARQVMQERILLQHLDNGVVIEDPGTTFIDQGVTIGSGSRILPCTVIRAGVSIGPDCEVGPFSHLRAGTYMEEGAEVGNFVEVKKSFIGRRTKAKHLTYLGDTTIGKGSNIGAGTITANYDGKAKHPTVIGDEVFVGSGTVLVAPVKMEDGSSTGAGAIVTRNTSIPAGDVYVGVPARSLKERKRQGAANKESESEE